jgi:hypothetical protein
VGRSSALQRTLNDAYSFTLVATPTPIQAQAFHLRCRSDQGVASNRLRPSGYFLRGVNSMRLPKVKTSV